MNTLQDLVRKLRQGPDARELAARELAEAERQALAAQSAREYYDSMVSYHGSRVERLRRYLGAVNTAA